jgi:UDP-N-acetylmuramoyl-tripeptide--D-alanyl-D-alanine ligase
LNKTIHTLYQHFIEHRNVTTDSRNVPQGAIFFALKGESFDGNAFAAEALKKGAALAVVDDPVLKGTKGCFVVGNVLATLQDLAAMHRKKLKAVVIGITGSNGKTTTKELIKEILSRKYSCFATRGNLNNHIGVPLTLLSLNESHEFAIIEMGANHKGEIADLSRLADPAYGLITNVGKAHLEGFGSFEGVVEAKTELYRYLKANNGKAFVNANNAILVSAAEGLPIISYGTKGNTVSGRVLASNPSLVMECVVGDQQLNITTNLVGAYNLENALAAATIGHHFGVEPGAIKLAIEGYLPDNNRSQVLQTPKNTLIMDAYNANPTSMEAALSNFADGDYDNKIVLLGEMLELGKDADREHDKVIEHVKALGFKKAFMVGSSYAIPSDDVFKVFNSTEDLIDHLMKYQLAGHTILIKGSRGNKLEKVVNYL